MGEKMKNTVLLSMVMLPARDNTFLTDNKIYKITIPRKGKYKDIDSEFFDDNAGEFDILDSKDTLFLPSITKVLFATKQYPDLKDDQLFVPISLKFKETEIDIIGQVVKFEGD